MLGLLSLTCQPRPRIATLKSTVTIRNVDNQNDLGSPLVFLDDGSGADYLANDGIYTAASVPGAVGNYLVQALVTGTGSTGKFQRSAVTRFTVVPQNAGITGRFSITPRVAYPM